MEATKSNMGVTKTKTVPIRITRKVLYMLKKQRDKFEKLHGGTWTISNTITECIRVVNNFSVEKRGRRQIVRFKC